MRRIEEEVTLSGIVTFGVVDARSGRRLCEHDLADDLARRTAELAFECILRQAR